jgi:hypothetical protein
MTPEELVALEERKNELINSPNGWSESEAHEYEEIVQKEKEAQSNQ